MVQKAKAMQETRCPSEATHSRVYLRQAFYQPRNRPSASRPTARVYHIRLWYRGVWLSPPRPASWARHKAICHKATLSTPVKGQMKIPKFADSFAKLIITRTPAGCLFRTLRFRLGQPARYSGYLRVRHQRYRGPGQSAPNFPVYGILALKSAGR